MEADFKVIVDNLTKYLEAKSDADIARGLGVTPQAVSGFRKKGKFPPELLINFCFTHQLSLDWLFTGRGAKSLPGTGAGIVAESPGAYSADPGEESLLRLKRTIDLIKEVAEGLKIEIEPVKMSHIIDFAFVHKLNAESIRDLIKLLLLVGKLDE